MSLCIKAMEAAKRAVNAPTVATKPAENSASSNKGAVLATRYTPAVTMVAA